MDKVYTIFAGVNGAGKSTLFRNSIVNRDDLGVRINVDDIVRENGGNWKSVRDLINASKVAINLINDCIDNGKSFNQETTLSDKSIFDYIDRAKNNDFTINMYFVGIDSCEIAKERIKARVQNGGHGIPDKDVERRYVKSLESLKKLINICDSISIYDNTNIFKKIAYIEKCKIVMIEKDLPGWLKEVLEINSRKSLKQVKEDVSKTRNNESSNILNKIDKLKKKEDRNL